MTRHDDRVSLEDMLNHSHEAVELLGDLGREELGRNRVMQLALTQLVEVVGEAANRVSESTRRRTPDVAWAKVMGMRNRLVHGYDVIRLRPAVGHDHKRPAAVGWRAAGIRQPDTCVAVTGDRSGAVFVANYKIQCEVVEIRQNKFDCCTVGETFVIGPRTPGGMCARAYAAVYPAALAMRFSEKIAWEKDDGTLDVMCPDQYVVYRLSRIKESAT